MDNRSFVPGQAAHWRVGILDKLVDLLKRATTMPESPCMEIADAENCFQSPDVIDFAIVESLTRGAAEESAYFSANHVNCGKKAKR